MRFCAVVTEATLAQARALSDDLREHHPGAAFDVLAVGAGTSPTDEAFGRVSADALAAEIDALAALYPWPDVEIAAGVGLLRALIARGDEDVVLLRPAVDLRAPLDPVTSALAQHAVVLSRRLSGALPQDGRHPDDADLLDEGLHSPALVAVRPGPRAQEIGDWWAERIAETLPLLTTGELARPHGRAAAELNRLLDLVPARFTPHVAALADPGIGVSSWNLHERALTAADGRLLANGRLVRLIDFSGFDPSRPYWLGPGADRVRVPDSPVLAEACERYAGRLLERGWRDVSLRDALGSRLPGGLVLDAGLVRRHEEARLQDEDFGDVLAPDGAERFMRWLAEPAPRGAHAGINRLLFGIWRDRPDLPRAYPDLDGPDGAGFAGWAWVFGRGEMGIPDRLLPPRPAHVEAGEAAPAAQGPDVLTVNVAGFFRGTLGLGAAARAYVDALSAAGVALTTTTVDLPTEAAGDPESGYAHVEFEDRSHAGPPMFNLICVNPDELPAFAGAVGEDFWAGRRSIGVWAWETDHIPERWQRAEGYIDEIWTYTRYVAQNIGRMAPVPVVPIPIPVVAPPPAPDPFAGELPDGFRFLFVFDLFSTIQRKNPIGLIDAFRRAFRPGEGPQLVVKTLHGVSRPQEFDELRWAARDRPDVFIVDRSLSATERDGLIASCDCYVSLHRSEGFGLTLAEAMAIGKPVIGTAYSGNLDFMTPANSYLVSYRPTRVGPRGEQYPADGWWAEPDLDHAATLMRQVWERPEEARRRGEEARADVARDLSPEVVGRIARARLARLAARGS